MLDTKIVRRKLLRWGGVLQTLLLIVTAIIFAFEVPNTKGSETTKVRCTGVYGFRDVRFGRGAGGGRAQLCQHLQQASCLQVPALHVPAVASASWHCTLCVMHLLGRPVQLLNPCMTQAEPPALQGWAAAILVVIILYEIAFMGGQHVPTLGMAAEVREA